MPTAPHFKHHASRAALVRGRWRVVSVLVSSALWWGVAGAGAATPLTLSESSNHHTVNVAVGATFRVLLHNTYWTLTPLPSTSALAKVGSIKVVSSGLAGSGCVPGQGCGTVTAHFVARHAGYARLSATRTSCGEAMRCTAAQGHWTVVVHVHG